MFQKRMVWSLVPPPVASKLRCHGHQARAFTAALCPCRLQRILPVFKSQISAWLSLLPEASPHASCFRPQTSPRCPWNFMEMFWAALTSCPRILVSLEPVNSMPQVNAEDETLPVCPRSVLMRTSLSISQISTLPSDSPTAKWSPWGLKESEQTYSSSSFWMSYLMLAGVQRQTLLSSPIDSGPLLLQSSRFRQQSSLISGASSTFSGERWIFFLVGFFRTFQFFLVRKCLTVPMLQRLQRGFSFSSSRMGSAKISLESSFSQGGAWSSAIIGSQSLRTTYLWLDRWGMKRSSWVFLELMQSYIYSLNYNRIQQAHFVIIRIRLMKNRQILECLARKGGKAEMMGFRWGEGERWLLMGLGLRADDNQIKIFRFS